MNEYIAFDTETYKGKAFLLTTENAVFPINGFLSAMKLLFSLGSKFTTFNIDYDVTALLADIPRKYLKKLHLEKECAYNGYKFQYLPKKVFICKNNAGKTITVYDIYPFFQTSLRNALKKYAPKTLWKKEISKSVLTNLTPSMYRKHKKLVNQYAIRDAAGTQFLTNQVVSAIADIGLSTNYLYSPGYIAKRYLIKNSISFGYVPYEYKKFVAAGYFGAYVQCNRKGFFPNAYQVDLKSAYPSAMAELPDLRTAKYKISKKIQSDYFFVRAKVWMKKNYFYLLPARVRTRIFFPQYTGQVATMTNWEYNYLIKNRLTDKIEIQAVLNIFCGKNKPYKKMVHDLYKKRSEKPFKKLVYKLILNSAYGIAAEKVNKYHAMSVPEACDLMGKMMRKDSYEMFLLAQIKRCANALYYWNKVCNCGVCKDTRKIMARKPKINNVNIVENAGDYYEKTAHIGKMQNLVVAAFITAIIRCRLFDVMRKNKESIIAVMTDGIFSTKKLSVAKENAKLGEWQDSGCADLIIIGSGVYQFGKLTKMRGYEYEKPLKSLLNKNISPNAKIEIKQIQRASLGQITRGGQWDSFAVNELIEIHKNMNLNFDEKRKWDRDFRNGKDVLQSTIDSQPFQFTDL